MENQLFQKSKTLPENLIKPMENEAFGVSKPKKAPKTIGKALPREGFRIAFSRSDKTLYNQWKINLFTRRKTLSGNLIKT